MITLTEIKNILQKNKNNIQKKYAVKSLGIFGSFVRNEQTVNSDIDILVEFEKPIGL